MQEILEFFGGLFATDLWPARWNCGVWSDFHGWLYIGSDIAIWAAYFLIPFVLAKYIRQKDGIPLSNVLYWFVAFILFCGLTHLMDAVLFWYPMYRLSAFIRFLTAVVSWITIIKIIQVYPQALALRTGAEYEAELNHRRKIERKLNEHTSQLERTVQDLEQFAYVASHDLQEPLNTIKSYIHIMEDDLSDKFSEEEKKYLKFTVESANRMQELLVDLLSYSRLGKHSDEDEQDLNEILDVLIQDLKSTISAKNAEVIIQPMPKIHGSKLELQLLFQNLITNGMKFNRAGSQPRVEVKVSERDDHFLFLVEDNGIGIHNKYSDRIFQIFQRLHSRKDYPGNGVGLSTCKKIVESAGGRIWFEDNNPGTKFIFTWPKK